MRGAPVNGGPARARVVGDYLRLARRELPPGPGSELPQMAAWCTEGAHLTDATGGVRAGAVLAMVDTVAGFLSGLAVLPRWIVTTNLHLALAEPARAPLELATSVLRRGRSSVVSAVAIGDREGRPVAEALVTSSVLDPPADMELRFDRPVEVDAGPDGPRPPFDTFFPAVAAGPGLVRMPLEERLRNPWGILHGGAVAALVDLAAAHAAADAAGPAVTTDVVLEFLSPLRVGPAEARTGLRRGRGGRRVVEVEVSDAGAGGRRTAYAVVTTEPAPRRGRR